MNRPSRWVVLSFALLLVLVSCSSKSSSGSKPANATTYAIGQTAKSGNFNFTVHGVADPFTPSNPYTQPKAGYRIVRVDLEVTNVSSSSYTFSSLLGLTVKDSQNRSYNETLSGEPGPRTPGGTMAPGQGERGYAYFQVPTDAQGLVLTVKGSATAAGSQFNIAKGAAPSGGANAGAQTTTTTTSAGGGGAAASLAQCGTGLSATQGISCELAHNVFYEYYKAVQQGKATSGLAVWSPPSKRYYTVTCSKGAGVITCYVTGTTVPNAQVQITQAALDAYTPGDASEYARTHDLGPRG